MTPPRFLADQNLDDDIVNGVLRREPAAEFLLAREEHVERLPDGELLAFAADRALIVVSHDVNTLIHEAYQRVRAGLRMPALLLAPRLKPIGPVIDSIVLIWASSDATEWDDQVQFLPL
jgi:hypothetical protein